MFLQDDRGHVITRKKDGMKAIIQMLPWASTNRNIVRVDFGRNVRKEYYVPLSSSDDDEDYEVDD